MTEHDQPRDNASILALQAYAELEAVNRTAWIDLDASTANLLVIRQSDGPTQALTLTDLLRLVRHEALAHHTVMAPTTHSPLLTAFQTTQEVVMGSLALISDKTPDNTGPRAGFNSRRLHQTRKPLSMTAAFLLPEMKP
ncbi:hypothetical protein [Larsenimonas rhizosphaerae]|uniref:Uncharacterized protein n=1 Tax=Larsenimonas rhizosphaerae TaxID=2944682 RepID=A0AA42CYI8_9GAMM|nr:hypothetical protein [Larsenimonas rhizosphaerae]MCX2525200.1 hypothetical protein [Larsenimonas rhizosphaerae]